MDENKNHINNRLGDQLPSHSPDQGTWQHLSAKLDAMDAETAYQERLQVLPVHSPDKGTWNLIYSRLNRIAYYKTGIRIALSVAAGLLLFFTVSRISDNYQTRTNKSVPQLVKQEQLTNPSVDINPANPVTTKATEMQETHKNTRSIASGNTIVIYSAGIHESVTTGAESERIPSGNTTVAHTFVNQELLTVEAESAMVAVNNDNVVIPIAIGSEVAIQSENNTGPATQNTSIHDGVSPTKEIINSETEPKSILFQKEQYDTTSPVVKNNVPIDPQPVANKNYFALAMNYLPENINNGTNNSVFHNVDLTASYNKEKIRFNTSVGMAYNEEQLQFDMKYNINSAVTAIGPGGKLDTVGMNVANLESQYLGTEKHEYFTYNLGIGRRLFSIGKFSTWINAGAGFGLRLNNPDLITSTSNSIKTQYNAQIVSVNTSKPVYNDVNVNFVTAIDFNYRILSRLSITFTPTSRWYFKPVLSLNNQATDELTLGFRTGMKFDF